MTNREQEIVALAGVNLLLNCNKNPSAEAWKAFHYDFVREVEIDDQILCHAIHKASGPEAVRRYLLAVRPGKNHWGWCLACKEQAPAAEDYSCLICGGETARCEECEGDYFDEEGDCTDCGLSVAA